MIARKRGRVSAGASPPQNSRRIEVRAEYVVRTRTLHVKAQLHRFAHRQPVEDAGNRGRDARPHEHDIDTCEHRAEERRQRRQLDLLEEVDADRIVVALAGQKHLDEVAGDGEFLEVPGLFHGHHGVRPERCVVLLAARR